MLIKILYLIFIFLIVRLVYNQIKKIQTLDDKRKNAPAKKSEKDYVDAEYKVIDD